MIMTMLLCSNVLKREYMLIIMSNANGPKSDCCVCVCVLLCATDIWFWGFVLHSLVCVSVYFSFLIIFRQINITYHTPKYIQQSNKKNKM